MVCIVHTHVTMSKGDTHNTQSTLPNETAQEKKKLLEKHLSPSRRRALCPFFAKQCGGENPSPAHGRSGVCGMIGGFTV